MNTNKNMNVVLYLRYSSDKQTEQSIEGQDRVCRAYCEQNGMTIVDTYIDRALSASKNTEKREDFLRMIKDSEKHEWEGVVVYKLDRFARNRYDSATYKNKLKKNGVRVISATENITGTPESILLESLLEGMAEFYSVELAQKITRGMHESALKCNSCGGHIPYGYKIINKKYAIEPAQAAVVKEAFEMYANGATIAQICEELNSRGYKTAKGQKFNKNSFHSMFKNERYTGVYIYKDIRTEGGMPAIISKELFNKVQIKMQKNERAPGRAKSKTDFLLSGKIFCGHCNSNMVGESGTGKNGTIHYYYTCANRKKEHSCNKKPLKKDFIEHAVVEDALICLTPENIEKIADIAIREAERQNSENKLIPAIQKEIHDIEKGINNLIKLAESGAFSPSLSARLNELEESKQAARLRLAEAETDNIVLDKKHVIYFLQQFARGNINDEHFRRLVIDLLVNSVTVWDEPDGWYKITTIYNLKGDNTATFRVSDLGGNAPPLQCNPNILVFSAMFCYTTRKRAR